MTSLVERIKTRVESIRSGATGGAPSSASAQVYWHSAPVNVFTSSGRRRKEESKTLLKKA